jgi:hypothetical protein
MKDYNLSPNQGAEKCPTDSFVSFGTYLKEPVSQCPRMRHSQIRAKRFHADCQCPVPRTQTDRPSIKLGLN